jgi:hypothetical protein
MAESKINTNPNNTPIIGACGIQTATASVEELANRLVRIGNVVHINLSLHFTNENIGSVDFASIPVGFRPSSVVYVPMVWRNAGGATFPIRAKIDTNGMISQTFGSNMAYVSISGTYTV